MMLQNCNYFNNQTIANHSINQLTLQEEQELYYKKMMIDFYQVIEPRLQYIPINYRVTYFNVAWQCYINGEISYIKGLIKSKQYTPLHEINDNEYLMHSSIAQIINEVQHKDDPLPLSSSIKAIEVDRRKIPSPFEIIKIRKGKENSKNAKNKDKEVKVIAQLTVDINKKDYPKPFIRNKRNRTSEDEMNNTVNNDIKIINTIKFQKVNKRKKTLKEQANELLEDSFLYCYDKRKKRIIDNKEEENEKGNELSDSSAMMIYYGDHYHSTKSSIDFMKYNFNFEHYSHYTGDRLIMDIEFQHVTIIEKEFMLFHNPDSLIHDSINLRQIKKIDYNNHNLNNYESFI